MAYLDHIQIVEFLDFFLHNFVVGITVVKA
jgi:hypothetical protein